MSELKDFYNNLDKETEDDETEEDSDFVPEDDDDDQNDNVIDEDADCDEEEMLQVSSVKEDLTEKKSRIDAIWAEMNQPAKNSSSYKQSGTSTELNRNIATKTEISPIPTTNTSELSKPNTTNTASATTIKSTPASSATTSTASNSAKRPSSILDQYHPKNKRPKSQLSALISKYNIKEPKMNTVEKSKLDWNNYVEKEGIKDELSYKNKDGYMEKVAFLQRVDDRRLNKLKEGQKSTKKN